MSSDTDAFDKVSAIIGDAMNDAWIKIIGDLADAAKTGKAPVIAAVAPDALGRRPINGILESVEC